MKKLNVAIIGQGRSGRDIHGLYFNSDVNTLYNVIAVVEKDPERRERALKEYPGCEVFESYTELFGRKDIDLVANASFSDEHYSITKDLLERDFNVVVEKPFARTRYECDDLIRIAKKRNMKLGVYHQSLFMEPYVHAKKVADSGKLGDILQVSIRYNWFARRWDWQTTQTKVAGGIYNTGPHPIGHGLGFLDFDDNVTVAFSRLGKALTSGDSDDYAKIILTAPNKPVIDIEVQSNDAFPDFRIKIVGTKGSYIAKGLDYQIKYIVDGENPPRPVILESLKDEEGRPLYCSEKLITHEEEGVLEEDATGIGGSAKFYEMMYRVLTEDVPMEIPPEYAAKVISVIETAHATNPLPLIY